MEQQLLHNETEYRQWAWKTYRHWRDHKNHFYASSSHHIAEAIGLSLTFECWDSIQNENGEWIDIDEDGNVIPEDTVENVKLQEWMNDVEFPAVVVYHLEKDRDRLGVFEGYVCDFVSLSKFNEVSK